MKKSSLLYTIVVFAVLVAVLYTSCKKPHHDLAPTPNNIRLMSYTATTWNNAVFPGARADTINENYAFSYNSDNTVSSILYTTNDTSVHGSRNIKFNYSTGNGYVIKTISSINPNPLTLIPTVFETDTIIQNSQLITIYSPGLINKYTYYGKLIATETDLYYNGATSVSDFRIFNSDNGNFLNYSSDRVLDVTFPNTMSVSPYPMRDYWVQTPLLPYSQAFLNYVITPNLTYTAHTNITTAGHSPYDDQLDFNTSGVPLIIFAKDTSNDTAYVAFPGTIWPSQTYTFYTNQANRTGDYLQLNSFTQWGVNLYQNTNLVQSIANSGYKTNVTYNIDAYNKITQMTATIIDSLANTKTITYNLQYEIY